MSLLDEIKKQVIVAMKAQDTVAKEVLRVAQGDIEMHHTRTGEHMTDEQAQKVVRKLMKSNEETLEHTTDPAAAEKLSTRASGPAVSVTDFGASRSGGYSLSASCDATSW